MVSVNIPPLPTLKWLSSLQFPIKISAIFTDNRLSALFRLDSGFSIVSFIIYSIGTFLAITLPAWVFLYSPGHNKIHKPFIPSADLEAVVNAASPERHVGPIVDDEYIGGITRDVVDVTDSAYEDVLTIDDADYAEELQFQETLIASIVTSKSANNNPSSSQHIPIANAEDLSTAIFCGICLDKKQSWLMFENETCGHSFCYDCTAGHIKAKIQEKVKGIACPSPTCKALLDFDDCRLMIPNDVLVEWDEFLCISQIPESQKLYCPFSNCSALLVNDFCGDVEKTRCLVCCRWFCAKCCVPWHEDFLCKEFQKLYAKKGGKVDKIVKELAKKKSWQKCPKCKMYVEKSEGCVHITCRCSYEFCYLCGCKWSDSHVKSCRKKS